MDYPDGALPQARAPPTPATPSDGSHVGGAVACGEGLSLIAARLLGVQLSFVGGPRSVRQLLSRRAGVREPDAECCAWAPVGVLT